MKHFDTIAVNGAKYALFDDNGAFLIVPLADDTVRNIPEIRESINRYYSHRRPWMRRARGPKVLQVYRTSPAIGGGEND